MGWYSVNGRFSCVARTIDYHRYGGGLAQSARLHVTGRLLPLVLDYNAYRYVVFRATVRAKECYHK